MLMQNKLEDWRRQKWVSSQRSQDVEWHRKRNEGDREEFRMAYQYSNKNPSK
jgi:hypothetical protein